MWCGWRVAGCCALTQKVWRGKALYTFCCGSREHDQRTGGVESFAFHKKPNPMHAGEKGERLHQRQTVIYSG
jgi:hypothetical protein